MTVESLLGLQIVADVVLCLAVMVLIRVIGREMKKKPLEECTRTMSEFRGVIEDARHAADRLIHALRDAEKAHPGPDAGKGAPATGAGGSGIVPDGGGPADPVPMTGHGDIVKMAQWGMSAEEIADTLDLSEGEVCLILDIHRKKNENSSPRDIVS